MESIMAEIIKDDGLLVSGKMYVRNRRVSGAGFVDVGNVTALKFTSSGETKTRESKQKGTYGQVLDSVFIRKGTEVSWSFDTLHRTNMALLLMGEVTVIAPPTARVVANVDYVIAKKGELIQLADTDIDPSTLKIATSDGKELAAADVLSNAALGLAGVASHCATVNDGDTVKVSYSTFARGGYRVDAQTVNDFDFEIKVDGYNHASGKDIVLAIPSAVVAADSAIDWLSGDFATGECKGNLVTVDGNKSPYSFTERAEQA